MGANNLDQHPLPRPGLRTLVGAGEWPDLSGQNDRVRVPRLQTVRMLIHTLIHLAHALQRGIDLTLHIVLPPYPGRELHRRIALLAPVLLVRASQRTWDPARDPPQVTSLEQIDGPLPQIPACRDALAT